MEPTNKQDRRENFLQVALPYHDTEMIIQKQVLTFMLIHEQVKFCVYGKRD